MQPQVPQQPVTPTPAYTPGMQPENPGKTLGIIGLVCAFLFPLVGIILSAIGLSKSKKVGMSNGLALAGLIISIVGTIAQFIIGLFFIIAVLAAAGACSDYGPGMHTTESGATITCS